MSFDSGQFRESFNLCDVTDTEHIAKLAGDEMIYREIVRDERAFSASKVWPCFSMPVPLTDLDSSGTNPLGDLVRFL